MSKSTLVDIIFGALLLNLLVMAIRVFSNSDTAVRDAAIASIFIFGAGGAASLFCRREYPRPQDRPDWRTR